MSELTSTSLRAGHGVGRPGADRGHSVAVVVCEGTRLSTWHPPNPRFRSYARHCTCRSFWMWAEHLDPLTYAPTPDGLLIAARSLKTDVKWLCRWAHLTPERYWSLRAAPHLVRDLERFAISLTYRQQEIEPGSRVDWEFFIPRRNRRIMLPARFTLHDANGRMLRPFYLWLDHTLTDAGHDPLQMSELQRLFRYLAKERAWKPTWLILTHNPQRLDGFTWAARRARFDGPMFFSSDFETALNQDPQLASWFVSHPDSGDTPTWSEQSPFEPGGLAQIDARDFAGTHHALPDVGEWKLAPRKIARKSVALSPPKDWPDDRTLSTFDQLTATQRQIVTYLSRHPGMSIPAMVSATDLPGARVADCMSALSRQGFVECKGELCFATPLVLKLMALRDSRDMKRSLALYAFHKQDRLRRLSHTDLGFAFFTRLKEDAMRVSRHRARLQQHHQAPMDVVTLREVRDEMACRAWVRYKAQQSWQDEWGLCEWRPDGYGLLRAGQYETPFWIEIGGTAAAPSKLDFEKWATKVHAWYRYFESGQWQAIYPSFPYWLVVLSVPPNSAAWNRRIDLLQDLLHTLRYLLAHGDQSQLHAFATTREALEQHGALAPVWTDLINVMNGDASHAFAGISGLGVELDL